MKKYEKTIGLKTVWLTIVRRFYYILFVFVPIALASLLVTSFAIPKTYQSSVTVSKTTVFLAAQHQILQNYTKDENTINFAIEQFNTKGIKHSNGDEINIKEIVEGLSFSSLDVNSIFVTVYYQSLDKTIVQPVLNELITATIDSLKNDETTKKDFATLVISSPASDAVKNSNERKYLLIGIAAGLFVSFGLAFVDEVISDELYDKADVELLGCDSFELRVD